VCGERAQGLIGQLRAPTHDIAHRIGTLAITILGVPFVPVFFVFIQRLSGRTRAQRQ
jgi:hypothetical protein